MPARDASPAARPRGRTAVPVAESAKDVRIRSSSPTVKTPTQRPAAAADVNDGPVASRADALLSPFAKVERALSDAVVEASKPERYSPATLRSNTAVGVVDRDDGMGPISRSVVTATTLPSQPLGFASIAFIVFTVVSLCAVVSAYASPSMRADAAATEATLLRHLWSVLARCKTALLPLAGVFAVNLLILKAIATVPRLVTWALVFAVPL